jgi:hypothetical protein
VSHYAGESQKKDGVAACGYDNPAYICPRFERKAPLQATRRRRKKRGVGLAGIKK